VDNERASEQGVADEAERTAYAPSRLTHRGAIARVTEDDPDDGSGIPR